MFAWTSHGTELKRFTRQPITRAAIAVMLLIPLLYGAMYVWAFWDPTTQMDQLPVALVNVDQAATDDDGETVHYGDDVVEELIDDASIGWAQVDAETAAEGVEAGTYYFAVTIPETFSSDILSLGEDDPAAAKIMVTYDDSNSFLASTLGRSAMLEVQSAVRKKVSKEAVNTLLIGVGDARDGFAKASDGAFELSDGLEEAVDGADQLNVGAEDLAEGSALITDGAKDLFSGSVTLREGLEAYVDGVTAAGDGAEALSEGASNLTTLTDGLAAVADTSTGAPALAAGVEELAASITSLADGVTSYAEGATDWATGAGSWASGARTWQTAASAATASDGDLAVGTEALADGAAELAESTNSSSDLATAASAVASGASSVASSSDDVDTLLTKAQAALDEGDSTSAADYLAKAASANDSAHDGAKTVASVADQVSAGIDDVHDGASDLSDGASALESGWTAVHAAVDDDGALGTSLTALESAQESLESGAKALTDGADTLADPDTLAEVEALSSGADTLSDAITALSEGASDTDSGIPALQDGMEALVEGFTASDPESGLISGAEALYDGSSELSDGLKTAKAALVQLSSGTSEMSESTPELVDGLTDAEEGATKIGNKLSDGADEIPDDSVELRHSRAKAVSTPVRLSSTHIWEADSWGEGFAPFFIALALWVGALITWLLLRPLQTRALMTSVNGFRMAWGSLNSALLLSLGQVTIMLAVMHFAVGLSPKNVLATFFLTLLSGAAFFALQQFFQVTLGPAVGKVVIIVMLMVQLASAGGTYPIQTTPAFLQDISPYMPMTYVVNGLREAITGGIETRFWVSVAVMAAIFVVSLVGSSIASARKRMWTMSRLHPALSI